MVIVIIEQEEHHPYIYILWIISILSPDEKYIILFGGDCIMKTNDIQLLNLKTYQFQKMNMVCPNRCYCHALIANNYDLETSKLLSFGFIRKCYKEMIGNANLILPPNEIIMIIAGFHHNPIVYLFEQGYNGNLCHKIDLYDVVHKAEKCK